MGINKIILEIDYNFEFKSHPELRQSDSTLTKKGRKEIHPDLCEQWYLDHSAISIAWGELYTALQQGIAYN